MKKLLIASLISLATTLLGLWVNYSHYQKTGHLLLAIKMWGGECLDERGFGLDVFHTYGMTPDQADTVKISFDPIGFVLTLVLIALLVYVILFLSDRIRKKNVI